MKRNIFFFLNYSYTVCILLQTVGIHYSSMAKEFLCPEEINWKEKEIWCAIVMTLVKKAETFGDRNIRDV